MVLFLAPHHLQTLQRHAEATYPEECCGLLLGIHQPAPEPLKFVRQVYETPNVWGRSSAMDPKEVPETLTPRQRYQIDPADLVKAQQYARGNGWDIIGIYHSHPDCPAVPSAWDREWAWPQYSYAIISVENGTVRALQSWILNPHHEFLPEKLVMSGETPPQVVLPLEEAHQT